MKILVTYSISRAVLGRFAEAQLEQDPKALAGCDLFVDWSCFDGPEYSLARSRNHCRQIAILGNYDIWLPMDADMIIEGLPTSWPMFGVAYVRYYNKPEYQPASWWALRREVFASNQWHEGFAGFHYEDWDFADTV